MSRAFQRLDPTTVRASVTRDELRLLQTLPDQLREVLEQPGKDAALARLLPPAYEDPLESEANDEYQRFMHDELRSAKLGALHLLQDSLERATRRGLRWSVDLNEEEALAWLGVLNDVRLTLGVRLGIKDDLDGEVEPDDPRAPGLHLLYYLGMLEEHLIAALSD